MKTITLQLHIFGLVQGVYFRETMRQIALELGISGWVRNRQDGSVEAVIQGLPRNLEKMIVWCRQGPPGARVSQVEVTETTGVFEGFERLPTC